MCGFLQAAALLPLQVEAWAHASCHGTPPALCKGLSLLSAHLDRQRALMCKAIYQQPRLGKVPDPTQLGTRDVSDGNTSVSSRRPKCRQLSGADMLSDNCVGQFNQAKDAAAVQDGLEVQRLLDTSQAETVAAEVQYLKQQLRHLPEWLTELNRQHSSSPNTC